MRRSPAKRSNASPRSMRLRRIWRPAPRPPSPRSEASPFDQPFGGRRLHYRLFAGPAGEFGTVRHDRPELRRDDIEPLGGFLADHVHGRAATRAGRVLGLDRHMHARQMGGKGAALGPTLCRAGADLRGLAQKFACVSFQKLGDTKFGGNVWRDDNLALLGNGRPLELRLELPSAVASLVIK
jgi:hypothetical protein